MTQIDTKRVYTDPHGNDGYRVFIDRFWPRGESKEKFHYDLWAKEIAPSDALRHWFHENPDGRWEEFASRYMDELNSSPQALALAQSLTAYPLVTLLYASRDTIHNNAVVLARYLDEHINATQPKNT